ncbi:MAG: hypothetical protein KBT36_01665 [Kurthia sp.]|nr:hypothetical protein [Candidatus Kurthia equi]
MDKYMDNPWFLRSLALVLAVLIFFTVRPDGTGNDIDSTSSGVRETVLEDVPVELRYDDTNFVVSGVPQTVDVKIEGPIGIVITTQTGRNFKVVVNVKDKPSGEYTMKFEPEGFSDKLNVVVNPKTVNLKVEERITKDVQVEPEINENQLADGMYVKEMTTEPRMVTVSGAKSAIDSISYVKATVSTEKGVQKTFEKTAGVKIFDRELNILNVDVEPKTVKVKVDIGEYNREVPVVVNQKGKPAKGYILNSLEPKTAKITIYGSKSNIDNIQQVTVDADVNGLKKSTTLEGQLQQPKGVTGMSMQSMDVKAKISKESTSDSDEETAATNEATTDERQQKTFENINVQLSGLNTNDFDQEFVSPETGQIDVEAEGPANQLQALEKSEINVSVDASQIDEGTIELPIQVDGSEGITFNPSMTNVKIKFTKREEL